jgi:signal transduction histidine kinase
MSPNPGAADPVDAQPDSASAGAAPQTPAGLKRRVEARDRLVMQAESVGLRLNEQVLAALARGEVDLAQAAVHHHEAQLRELTENLRIYQVELHAQADELQASQARTEAVLNRFATLFASMPVAALLVAANGEVLEANAMATRLLGLRTRAGVARFLHRLVQADDYQNRVRPGFHEATAHGVSALDGVAFIDTDGRRFIADLHIACLPGPSSAEGQFACAVIDRTEHIEDLRALESAAEALRQSEAFLADSARLARIGGWELALWPRTLRWSRELRAILEVEPDTPATVEAMLGFCAARDRTAFADAVAAAELGQAFEIEIEITSARGRPMRALAVGHADAGDGFVMRVSGVLQDITSQHQARRLLGDLTERLSMAHEAGGIAVWDWDLASGKLVFDHRMCQLLGCDAAPAGGLGDALRPHLQAADVARMDAAQAAAIERLEPINVELRRTAPEGCERWLHVTGRAHADASGRAVRLLGCAWDSSTEHEALHLLAAKESAESASRAKSAFLSRMSHELRTPLNAIMGFSQLMRMEAEAGDLTLKPHRVALIESAARHLLDLVNEVLDVSRIEAGRLDLRLAPFDLRRIGTETVPMVQGLADRMGISIIDEAIVGEPCIALGDRLRLKEVVINLLSNAVKYNLAGGRVVLAAQHRGDHAELSVADTGRGLDARQLDGLFQPFNRVGAEMLGVEGSGMGLYVSRQFVELMGGSIAVESRPGAGTTVRVRLNLPARA